MKIVRGINFIEGSREEELPNFESNFPYIASRVELNQYAEDSIPWHWHKSVEVFYVEQGNLEYRTPNGHYIFPQGSGQSKELSSGRRAPEKKALPRAEYCNKLS